MPEGAARSYISLWRTILHTPLFCRFIPWIFQKYTKNHHLYCHFPHLKVPVKSTTCLECTIQNRGVRCACTYAWAHNNKYLWRTSNFFSITFSEILSYFSNRINRLKIINFKKVGLTFIKNNHTYFWKMVPKISTNIDYWQGHERYLCMVTCGLLTNHRHGKSHRPTDVWTVNHNRLHWNISFSSWCFLSWMCTHNRNPRSGLDSPLRQLVKLWDYHHDVNTPRNLSCLLGNVHSFLVQFSTESGAPMSAYQVRRLTGSSISLLTYIPRMANHNAYKKHLTSLVSGSLQLI